MKLHKAREKPVTPRQLAILAAISFGEVYMEISRGGRDHYVHWFERPHEGKATPTDITQTLARMKAQKLVRFRRTTEDNRPRGDWQDLVLVVTPRGKDVAEDACIDLL